MSEPALSWTAPALADLTLFMTDKIWFKVSDQTATYDAWVAWADVSGSTEEKAIKDKFSGQVMDFTISNRWFDGWPDYTTEPTAFQYTTKWSGGCIRDYSSGMGGFCVIEDNDTHFWDCGDIDSEFAAPARDSTPIIICGNDGTTTYGDAGG